MTYCLGWRTEDDVILAADGAVTAPESATPIDVTSFGELRFSREDGRVVEERALKIFQVGSVIVTFAGAADLGYKVVDTLQEEIGLHQSSSEAIKMALANNIPTPANCPTAFIFGFREEGKPVLLSFNADRDGKFIEHVSLVQLGSVPNSVKQLTENFLSSCVDVEDTVGHKMAKLLGVLQAYGRMGPLMVFGAGGAFSAVCLHTDGINWQPDILYISHHSDRTKNVSIGVCRRHECLVAKSNKGDLICLMNKKLGESKDAVLARGKLACSEVQDRFAMGKFDYIVFQNIDNPAVAVLEMARKKKHNLLWIEHFSDSSGSGLVQFINPELNRILDGQPMPTGPTGNPVYFLPYELPSSDCPIAPVYKKFKNRIAVPM